jgi:NAD(P)-dependent dehydrogenase (short-subunit alcohol dehydrogenase family)
MQAALTLMRRDGIEGSIVNLLSVNAHGGTPELTAYSASKGALATLTRNVANSVLHDRIRVNGINLGWTETPGEHDIIRRSGQGGDDWLHKAEAGRPFGRLIQPEEVARLIGFLASAESGVMTGSLIDFDQQVMGLHSAPERHLKS